MIRVAIVEDDKKSADALEALIKDYQKQTEQIFDVKKFKSAISFLDSYKAEYDIVLMDINMPGMNGMDAAHELRNLDNSVIIIFVTDMAQYAIEGYEVNALDFIVKPVKYYSLSKSLNKALKLLADRNQEFIVLKHNGSTYRVSVLDIKYVEVSRHRLIYHTLIGDIEDWGTLDNVEKLLSNKLFIRCHLAYLVGVRYIVSVEGNDVILDDNTRIKISRNRKNEFMSRLAGCFGEQ